MNSLVWLSTWLLIFLPPGSNTGIEIVKEDVLPRAGTPLTFKIKGDGDLWSFPANRKDFVRTCGVGSIADFWFITEHVDISSTIAEVIFVDVEAELTLCLDPGQSKNTPCSFNYFEVYIYRGDNKPTIDSKNLPYPFSPLYNITNDSSSSGTLPKQNLTFSFYPNNTKGVTFAVRSRGACGRIYHMKMYYQLCEETFKNSIKLRRTLSPLYGSKLVTANCSENSKKSNSSTRLEGSCHSNGSWSMNENSSCLCIEGYEPNTKHGCTQCSSFSFKNEVSNSNCTKCPLRSKSSSDGTSCDCKNGSYKSPSEKNDLSPCYELLALKERPKIEQNKNNATVTWNEPDRSESLNDTIFYDVECFLCQSKICNITCNGIQYFPGNESLKVTTVVVTKLQPGKEYVFRVYPKNNLNKEIPKKKWTFKETESFTVSKPPSSESNGGDATGKIVITVVVVLLVVLIFSFVIFVCRRRGSKKTKNMEAFLNSGGDFKIDLPRDGLKPYVDPANYSNVEEAVLEFANELDPRLIFLERMIGGGEFGDVYKGELTTNDESKIPIAAKTLKYDASSKSSRDFLLEASVMAQFNNPNIVRMEGVITKTKPRMIIIEYMSNGSLESYLKSNDGTLTRLQLLGMARGVASGMNYLAEINFVHRDLAARNVLVNDALFCKISDFGLSRELEATESSLGEYATSGGKIPIRWTAPEAIKYRKFSTASDVWSYGILLWEIMSFAQRPYWEWDNFKVVEEVDEGYRLPPPQKCPTGVHGLMLHCWKAERSERPSFSQITIVIDRWIRSPETLDNEVNFFITIGEWLTSIKMGSYKTMFVVAGYRKQSDIINLSDDDLKNIGVTLIGHRNKIMKGIETLKARKTRQSTTV